MLSSGEPALVTSFKNWLSEHGGTFHANAIYTPDSSGFSIIAQENIPKDTAIAKCPLSLVITEELSRHALGQYLPLEDLVSTQLWTERQWITSYIVFHWIVEDSSRLHHHAYLSTFPPADQLRTPLHFTPVELEMFRGTNLYHATLDREREWKDEWMSCRKAISEANPTWGANFTWGFYQTAATYLSSRAFPSSLVSPNPSLLSSPTNKPVLLPGIDAFNHGRGQPVSWVVSFPRSASPGGDSTNISLVLHAPTLQGAELLNNYGPKPNSELILGYGFSLPNNPDDTIVLKVGGLNGTKWEVGRRAHGITGLWDEILASVRAENLGSRLAYEDDLDAAWTLSAMARALLDRLPRPPYTDEQHNAMRPDVLLMLGHYVEGQRNIVDSVEQFARTKEQAAVENARADGIEILFDNYTSDEY